MHDGDQNSTDLMKCVSALQEKEEDEGSPVGETFLQIQLVTHHL